MELATSGMIPMIDSFAEKELNIPVTTLMGRSGEAVAKAVRELCPTPCRVSVLAGSGNNGGDGYAAAFYLLPDYKVCIYDVFSRSQKNAAGENWRQKYLSASGKIKNGMPTPEEIDGTDCVIDAIFGTGFSGEIPREFSEIVSYINSKNNVKTVSVDLPLGVNADDGSISDILLDADVNVSLSYSKVGVHSYPAREHIGKIVVDDIGISREAVNTKFVFKNYLTDFSLASLILPKRKANSSKGTFGKAMLLVGSEKYPGAAMLALEATLRGGVGVANYVGTPSLCQKLQLRSPEAIYTSLDHTIDAQREKLVSLACSASSVLIGSGSEATESLYLTTSELLGNEGGVVVLDADAINSIAFFGTPNVISNAKRKVVLTPHPLELSRLIGLSVAEIQANRYSVARDFAQKHNCILVLKGAATIVTDGETTYVNSSGSSALAKAGSGDVLAGLITSLLAFSHDPLKASALAVYIHGRAADILAKELSEFGVTPSDLPRECARVIASLIK